MQNSGVHQKYNCVLERNRIDLTNKKLVLFGTGQMSKILKIIPAYYVDNNKSKWGKSFKKRMINPPQALKAEAKDKIFIIIASQFYQEIALQLNEMGFAEGEHFFSGKPFFEKEVERRYLYKFRRATRRLPKRYRQFLLKYKQKHQRHRLKSGPWLIFPPKMGSLSYFKRVSLLWKFKLITKKVPCPHTQDEIITFVDAIFRIPPEEEGCIVEAGSYKGGSTSKFSLAAKIAGRELYIFDSFAGLPDNSEPHEKSILGHSIKGWFRKGKYCGSLEEVKNNIAKYGEIGVCHFIKGWFEETMPLFNKRIAAAYLDVDLASSTKTCLKYLYPLLVPGGVIISQDGDFPLVIEVYNDERFWEEEVGCKKPYIEGLDERKLIKTVKR